MEEEGGASSSPPNQEQSNGTSSESLSNNEMVDAEVPIPLAILQDVGVENVFTPQDISKTPGKN